MTATRVLFFAEPATAAHVGRPVVLARGLAQAGYDVSVATGPDYRQLVDAHLPVHDLWSIGTRAYLAAVAAGRPVFPYSVLERYVADDARVVAQVRPDVIVGDFRLSLAVSARLAGIPYLALSNAYWSPLAAAHFTVPVHRATRLVGPAMADRVFRWLQPMILAQHVKPMQRLRRAHGMPPIAHGLRGIFTEADVTVFADVPELVPTAAHATEGRYMYLGPVVWSPSGKVPDDVRDASDSRPLIYVSLGSSGDPGALRTIVAAAVSLGCRVAVATAGLTYDLPTTRDVIVHSWLPGDELAALARVVICNGGSPATHQALRHGTPVLGIPANLDQLLNMHYITTAGAGLSVRADSVTTSRIRSAVERLLGEPRLRDNAARVEAWFGRYASIPILQGVIERVRPRR